MAVCGADISSERLALEVNRADVETELQISHAVTQKLTDQLAAIDMQLQEITRLEDSYSGQRMQKSIYTAMLADSRALTGYRQLEQKAIDDLIAAAAVQDLGGTPPPIPGEASQQVDSGHYDDERLTQLEEAALDAADDISAGELTEACTSVDENRPASITNNGSALAGDKDDPVPVTLESYMRVLRHDETQAPVECIVCTDTFLSSQTVSLKCGHTWCRGCISQRYEEATVNEGAWPVKCCRTQVSMESVRNLLSLDLRTRFAIKAVEWADKDRTYCHQPSCSTYLPHSSITDRRASCNTCHLQTCTECKCSYHEQPPCPEVARIDDLLADTARENQWPKCPGCKRYVEMTTGCNHMTCRCSTEFCYECSAIWKECGCAQWDEERLFERANEVAGRQNRADVGGVVGELISRHDCTHENWRREYGGGTCDECGHDLPVFLWRCQRCHLDVCTRCRFHRL